MEKKIEDTRRLLMKCDCEDPLHTIEFYRDMDTKEIFVIVVHDSGGFFHRVKEAVSYIFGQPLIVSETILYGEQIEELIKLLESK